MLQASVWSYLLCMLQVFSFLPLAFVSVPVLPSILSLAVIFIAAKLSYVWITFLEPHFTKTVRWFVRRLNNVEPAIFSTPGLNLVMHQSVSGTTSENSSVFVNDYSWPNRFLTIEMSNTGLPSLLSIHTISLKLVVHPLSYYFAFLKTLFFFQATGLFLIAIWLLIFISSNDIPNLLFQGLVPII